MRLDDYLRKIGIEGPLTGDLETLRRLHLAHRQTFLFENITIQCGGEISLTLPDLEHKFIDRGAGGYCFEHNTLFATVLRELEFDVTVLLARVRRGPPERWVRTHMVLRVTIDGRPWLADVGFGGLGLLEPMPLEEGRAVEQGGAIYALRRDAGLWVLSMQDRAGAVTDVYEFSDDPQTMADVEVANHYTSTHPESMFRRILTIQRTAPDGERTILRTGTLVRFRDGVSTEEVVDPSRLRAVVKEVFGVDLPAAPLVFESNQPAQT